MTALHGRIEPGTVANVLQYLALSRAHGRLTLVQLGARQGNVYFEAGLVVSVEANPLRDIAALAAILAWDNGTFVFRRDVAPPRRSMRHEVEHLLMQVSLGPAAPANPALSQDAVLAAASIDSLRATMDDQFYAHDDRQVLLSLGALHLWRTLDGASSLRQLAQAARRPITEVVEAGQELLQSGMADLVSLVVADPRFALELKREAIDLLGPVGEVIIDDAFLELGLAPESLPVSAVGELFSELGRSFPQRSRAEFMRRATALRDMFALDAPAQRAARGRQATS